MAQPHGREPASRHQGGEFGSREANARCGVDEDHKKFNQNDPVNSSKDAEGFPPLWVAAVNGVRKCAICS